MPSLEALLNGPPVKKILFMSSPQVVDDVLKPHWEPAVLRPGFGASVLQVSEGLSAYVELCRPGKCSDPDPDLLVPLLLVY